MKAHWGWSDPRGLGCPSDLPVTCVFGWTHFLQPQRDKTALVPADIFRHIHYLNGHCSLLRTTTSPRLLKSASFTNHSTKYSHGKKKSAKASSNLGVWVFKMKLSGKNNGQRDRGFVAWGGKYRGWVWKHQRRNRKAAEINRKNPRDLVSRLNLSVILGKSLKLSGHSFCHMTISCLMEVTSKNLATLTF